MAGKQCSSCLSPLTEPFHGSSLSEWFSILMSSVHVSLFYQEATCTYPDTHALNMCY